MGRLITLKGRTFRADAKIFYRMHSPLESRSAQDFMEQSDLVERLTGFVPLAELPLKDAAFDRDPETYINRRKYILVRHLINHLQDFHALCEDGIPRFDLELMKHKGYEAFEIVNEIYMLLWINRNNGNVIRDLHRPILGKLFHTARVRELLVKTLLYIEELKLAQVDWARVRLAFPSADKVKLNIDDDSVEGGFYFVAAIEETA